jgi:hypothetical protein
MKVCSWVLGEWCGRVEGVADLAAKMVALNEEM